MDGRMTPETDSFEPGPQTQRAFRDALGRFATGVTVITTPTAEGPIAIVANSFASLSLDPPLVLWSPARASRRFHHFAEARDYAIHVLAADQAELCAEVARDGYVFGPGDLAENEHGVPILENALARFDCRQEAVHSGGDHVIIVGRVLRVRLREGEPLLFLKGQYGGFRAFC
ncbi:flavin reductase family protein [Roseivivax sp. CAU 1761]